MTRPNPDQVLPSSFRDPDGFVFRRKGTLFRQVNRSYSDHYDQLMSSGLYNSLVKSHLLIPHQEADTPPFDKDSMYKVIRPEPVKFISYPYEWSFSQFKNAALATLQIQKKALEFGMTLKDCSAYNIQFHRSKPVMIDTLSFESYREGQPWVAYRQFCRHFLAPLALMSATDVRLGQLFRNNIDGIPLDLACKLLPFRCRFRPGLLTHLYLHAKSQTYFANKTTAISSASSGKRMSALSLKGLIESLVTAVTRLSWTSRGTEWGNYYEDTNYSSDSFQHKKELLIEYLNQADPGQIWDLGANTGVFSRIASAQEIPIISFDGDPVAVEKNYLQCVTDGEANILPLVTDLTNPSPGIGWRNMERMSFCERGPVDMIFALALIHHLRIGNNLPLSKIAEFFHGLCGWLVIEFVPKSDSQVRRLLRTREDIFPDYKQETFEEEFSRLFKICESTGIRDSERTLYLMKSRRSPD